MASGRFKVPYLRFNDLDLQDTFMQLSAKICGNSRKLVMKHNLPCSAVEFKDAYTHGCKVPKPVYQAALNELETFCKDLSSLMKKTQAGLVELADDELPTNTRNDPRFNQRYFTNQDVLDLMWKIMRIDGHHDFMDRFPSRWTRYQGGKSVRKEVVDYCMERGERFIQQTRQLLENVKNPINYQEILPSPKTRAKKEYVGTDADFIKLMDEAYAKLCRLDAYGRITITPTLAGLLEGACEMALIDTLLNDSEEIYIDLLNDPNQTDLAHHTIEKAINKNKKQNGSLQLSDRTGINYQMVLKHKQQGRESLPVDDFKRYLASLHALGLSYDIHELLSDPENRLSIDAPLKAFVTKTILLFGEKEWQEIFDRIGRVKTSVYKTKTAPYLYRQDLEALLDLAQTARDECARECISLEQRVKHRRSDRSASARKKSYEMFELIGVDKPTHHKLMHVYKEVPEYSDLFTAKFLATHLDYSQIRVVASLEKHPNLTDDEYAKMLKLDVKEARRILNKLHEQSLVEITTTNLPYLKKTNKQAYMTKDYQWRFRKDELERVVEDDRKAVRQSLLASYRELEGEYYQCTACSTFHTFDRMYETSGVCDCGSRDMQRFEEHPKKALIAETLKSFLGIDVHATP